MYTVSEGVLMTLTFTLAGMIPPSADKSLLLLIVIYEM